MNNPHADIILRFVALGKLRNSPPPTMERMEMHELSLNGERWLFTNEQLEQASAFIKRLVELNNGLDSENRDSPDALLEEFENWMSDGGVSWSTVFS